jgi:Flp pilus assembly protein TadG
MGTAWMGLKLGQLSRRAMMKASTWLRQESGSIQVLYALALIPMIGALGLATDTARGYLVKARLSQSVDAAVLAGGKVYFASTREDDVLKYFAANFPTSGSIGFDAEFQSDFMDAKVTVNTPTEGGVEGSEKLYMSASAIIPTTFMRVLGINEVTVVAEAEVERTVKALDAVISLDMSGSMDGSAKIGAARDAALEFINTVYGPGGASPTITIEGTTYNLVNMGFVPWNSKVNVTTQGQAFSGSTSQGVASFTNPVTGLSQSQVYFANNSFVPLLMDPRDTSSSGQLPGGWSGCVYARYVGGEATPGAQNNNTGSVNDNDADWVRGPQLDVGSGSTQKDWPAWEPIARFEGEPRSGSWNSTEEPVNTRWRSSSGWQNRSCSLAYYNDFQTGSGNTYTSDNSPNLDNADGSIKIKTSSNTSRPAWVRAATASPDSNYSGTMRFFNDNTRPHAVPVIGSNPGNSDCTPCQSRSIIPLTPNKTTLSSQIGSITDTDPNGNTNIMQGLYWAWEVLMPGVPFDQAVPSVPFARDRAIILLTDGAQVGGNGDAYKGRFGSGEIAGDNTDPAHGTIATGNNNLDNRLRQLALNVKAEGIKLYVIGFDLENNPDELAMLAEIATPPDVTGSYFFNAPSAAELQAAFAQIASQLTSLRLSM